MKRAHSWKNVLGTCFAELDIQFISCGHHEPGPEGRFENHDEREVVMVKLGDVRLPSELVEKLAPYLEPYVEEALLPKYLAPDEED